MRSVEVTRTQTFAGAGGGGRPGARRHRLCPRAVLRRRGAGGGPARRPQPHDRGGRAELRDPSRRSSSRPTRSASGWRTSTARWGWSARRWRDGWPRRPTRPRPGAAIRDLMEPLALLCAGPVELRTSVSRMQAAFEPLQLAVALLCVIENAVQACADERRPLVEVHWEAAGEDHLAVEVVDNGPGLSAEAGGARLRAFLHHPGGARRAGAVRGAHPAHPGARRDLSCTTGPGRPAGRARGSWCRRRAAGVGRGVEGGRQSARACWWSRTTGTCARRWCGCSARSATTCAAPRTGEAALEELRRPGEPPPALMLLDLRMPRMDGRRLQQEIARDPVLSGALIPVIVLSADSRPTAGDACPARWRSWPSPCAWNDCCPSLNPLSARRNPSSARRTPERVTAAPTTGDRKRRSRTRPFSSCPAQIVCPRMFPDNAAHTKPERPAVAARRPSFCSVLLSAMALTGPASSQTKPEPAATPPGRWCRSRRA